MSKTPRIPSAIALLLLTACQVPIAQSTQPDPATPSTPIRTSAETAGPKNQAEWKEALDKTLMRNIRSANSSFSTYGGGAQTTAVLGISVTRDGRVIDIRILESAGNSGLDAALLRAASRTKIVAPFTQDMKGDVNFFLLALGTQRG